MVRYSPRKNEYNFSISIQYRMDIKLYMNKNFIVWKRTDGS